MKNKTVIVGGLVLFLCLFFIAIKTLQNEEIPGLLIGFTGALCVLLFRCIFDSCRKNKMYKL